jgi:hypothetical protein
VIDQGLRAGEQVVVDGAIRIAQGAQLKVTPYKASEGATAAPAKAAADPTAGEQSRTGNKGKPEPTPAPAPMVK